MAIHDFSKVFECKDAERSDRFARDVREAHLEKRRESSELDPTEQTELDELRTRRYEEDERQRIIFQAFTETFSRASGNPLRDLPIQPAADQSQSAPDDAMAGVGGSKKNPEVFLHRSDWLKNEMRRGSLTSHRIEVLGGPSKHTVQKILRGETVREDVLDRLARALGIEVTQIPAD